MIERRRADRHDHLTRRGFWIGNRDDRELIDSGKLDCMHNGGAK
jgi:hypothetical protein